MKFPTEALLVLLKFARGLKTLDQEVFEAGIEVLKYIYEMVTTKISGATPAADMTPEQMIEAVLADHVVANKGKLDLGTLSEALPLAQAEKIEAELSDSVKAFGPGIWITLGLWIAEQILKRVLK